MIENSKITAIVTDAQPLNVTVGQAATLEVGQAINYIKSGEAEISNYVDGTVKPAINAYVTNTAEPMIDSYVNTTVKSNIDNYVTNTAEPAIDTYVTNTAIPQVESYVDLAKDWAIKTDGTVDGVDYSSKYYAQLILPLATDITTLAAISTDITNVSSMSTAVSAVSSNATNINAVAGDLSNINTVANDISNIDSVAGNSTNINTVASNASNINTVVNNMTAIVDAPTYANLAKDWANKTSGIVADNEYSAKYYAEKAAQSAASIVPTYRGDFDSAVQYYKGDIVSWGSYFFQAIQNNIGQTYPNNVYYWSEISNTNMVNYYVKSDNIEYPLAMLPSDVTGNSMAGPNYFPQNNKPTINASTGILTANAGIVTATQTQGDNSTKAATTAYVDTGLNNKQNTLVSGTNIKTINNNSILGSGNLDIDVLPIQTGQNGKFLSTNGTNASWETITIPTVNNATLTITQGGVNKGTFTANASSDVTIALDGGGDIDTLLATLYPVGAIYIGTQATCPLETLISGSTWTIVGTSIITNVSIPSTIAVYGNGKTLGYTDGTNNLALLSGGDGRVYPMAYGYDKNVGTAGSGGNVTSGKYIGVVADTSGKSGLVAKSDSITKTSITVNIWQRTA